ncbi:MAG: hypothetical protein MJ240_11610 [Kiritimatiellae bacterium]|nr:hypothetical protein [Kiritimatiellia bacterium]
MQKPLSVVFALLVFFGFSASSAEPYTCHWTGDAKNGNWWDTGNWAEGVVPGVYTELDTEGNLVTNGCRGCTAVFGRVANNGLDSRRCIHGNPYKFNPDAEGCLFSIGHIVFDAAVDAEHPDYVLPEYVFSNSLTWQWGEPYLPLEGGGSIELKASVDKPVYFDSSLVLGAHETTSQTYRLINNSPTTVAFHRLTTKIGDLQWSRGADGWFSNAIRCEGTGDIVLMVNGVIPRVNQEYSWHLAMTGGRLLVRKALNLGTKAYANIAAQSFQLRTPENVGPQVLDIEEGCSFAVYCDNSLIVDACSDLRVSGDGQFILHSGSGANREFYIRNGVTVEIAGTITNNSTGTFANERVGGLRLVTDNSGGGTFFVSGTNAIPGAVQIGQDIAYVASTIGNIGEHKQLGAGRHVQIDSSDRITGGLLKYTGSGEYSTKILRSGNYAGTIWNAGTGDLFFAGVVGGWSDFKITLTNDGVHAIGLTGDVVSARPIVAPGALVKFAPPEGADAASIDVTNMIVSAGSSVAIADGASVRIHALYRANAASTVNILMDEAGGARLVIDNLTGFNNPTPPGLAPDWIRVNGHPARFTEALELQGLAGDDLEIPARGGVVPNAPTKTVAVTTPGVGEKDTLAANETKVVLLRNRETAVAPVIELGEGQTLTAPIIAGAEGATPIVFTGAGDFGSTGVGVTGRAFTLLEGTVVRSNETAGVAMAVTAADADVTFKGRPDVADASFAVTVERGTVAISTAGSYALDSLRIDNGAQLTLANAAFAVTNLLRVGQTANGVLVVEDGVAGTGRLGGAGSGNSGAARVQRGGEICRRQGNNVLLGARGHGYYELNGGRLVNDLGQITIGNQGTTVFAQYGGEFHSLAGATTVRARDEGYSVFYQKAGLFHQSAAGSDVYVAAAYMNGQAAWIIDGPEAETRVRSATDGRNFVVGANENYGSSIAGRKLNYVLAVNNGGMIHAGSIAAPKGHAATSLALVNFNGGVFRNNYAYGRVFSETGAQWFDPIDRVTIFEKGMIMQADVSCSTKVPLDAPTGKGVASIAWTDTEAEFVGAPAVRIKGAGYGATAVADYDSTTRTVKGIVVTSPGCDYEEGTVAEVLYGNDGNASKVVATLPCTLVDNVSGGFTMRGNASFRFSVTNTYTGATIIEKGTLMLDADDVINPKSALVLNGGTLDLNNMHQTFSSIACNGGTVKNGKVEVSGLAVDFDAAKAGQPLKVDLAICVLAANAPLAMRNVTEEELATVRRVVLAEFLNGAPAAVDTTAVEVPKGWAIVLLGDQLILHRTRGIVLNFR